MIDRDEIARKVAAIMDDPDSEYRATLLEVVVEAAVHTYAVEGGDPEACTRSDVRMMNLLMAAGVHTPDMGRALGGFFGGWSDGS